MNNKPKDSVRSIVDHILSIEPNIVHYIINQRREYISNLVFNFHNNQVAYGPFKGLKISTDNHWGIADKGAMTLGLYEKDILNELVKLKSDYDIFIDLGAADGYYGIGVIVSKIFKKSYCFEISDKGREVIQNNALLNSVSDNVVIYGIADKKFHEKINPENIKKSVLFVDIEGGEFELFDKTIFKIFRHSVIFIELHDWFYTDASDKISRLKSDSSETHTWNEIKMGERDLSKFNELESLSDSDRWLLCSEGRAKNMTWVKLMPLIT